VRWREAGVAARLFRIFFVLAALAALAMTFAPASLLIPQRHGVFTYGRADGTIWKARFEEARIAELDAGKVDWRLSAPDVFRGRLNAQVTFGGDNLTGDATLVAGLGGDRRLVARRVRIEGAPLGGMSLEGATTIENLDISYAKGRCTSARGAMVSEIPTKNVARLRWVGPRLSGQAQCAGDAALITLNGAGEGSTLRSVLELKANGQAVWRAEVSSDRVGGVQALGAAGFRLGRDAKSADARREFRWFPF
jgi:hypothetical protein